MTGVGSQLTVKDNYGERRDGHLEAQWFHEGARFIVIRMNVRDIDGDCDELEERIEAEQKPKKRRKGG